MAEQKWPSNLVIVRHGESERNVAKEAAKLSGQAGAYAGGLRDVDTPLTALGQKQALATGKWLAGQYTFDVAFSSPYLRAKLTTDALLQSFAVRPRVVIEERVREIEFGILDGLTSDGIKARYPEEYERRKREGKYWYRPPGGESRPDVALRVHSLLGTLARDYREKSVLVVCHSVVVLVFRRLLERWEETQYLKVDSEDDVKNCSVTAYRYDPEREKLVLQSYNAIYCEEAAKV
jgi:2,3-bisphosphoglycerate-dependent phosphoglycerate mutase